jgi:integrase
MRMGRPRTSNPLGLDPKKHARLHPKHGAFYYIHRDGHWEHLGADLNEAKRKAALYNDPDGTFGTIAYYLDAFVIHCEAKVKRKELAQRTYEDYKNDADTLKTYFGKMTPAAIEPKHKAGYLDLGAELGRPVRANREIACMSSMLSWLARSGDSGVKRNPWIGAGIKRNKETPRERYVEHAEYQAVRKLATRKVRGLMDLIYRTLQRPEDIINWTPANIITKREPDGTQRKIIRNKQGKTGTAVDIAVTPDIEAILLELKPQGASTGPGMMLIHTGEGKAYSYDGLCAMLRRYIAKTEENKARKEAGQKISSFGFYDLKGKGATDMWLSGVPLEQIQVLCGHDSVRTTEVYVKCRWRGTVEPNMVLVAS